jgi:MbtH protein
MFEDDNSTIYLVLINDEEQYSLWPKHKAIPNGWRTTTKEGSKSECCQFVDEVWTDMRPLSLRKRMDEPPSRSSSER